MGSSQYLTMRGVGLLILFSLLVFFTNLSNASNPQNSNSHFLRSLKSSGSDHFLRSLKSGDHFMRALRSSGGDHFLRSLKSGDHFMRALRSYGGYKRGSKDLQRILRSDPAMINEDHADFLDEENNELDRATRTSDHFMRALRSKDPYEHFLRSLRSANDLMRMVRSDSHFLRSLRSPTTNEEEEVVEA